MFGLTISSMLRPSSRLLFGSSNSNNNMFLFGSNNNNNPRCWMSMFESKWKKRRIKKLTSKIYGRLKPLMPDHDKDMPSEDQEVCLANVVHAVLVFVVVAPSVVVVGFAVVAASSVVAVTCLNAGAVSVIVADGPTADSDDDVVVAFFVVSVAAERCHCRCCCFCW